MINLSDFSCIDNKTAKEASSEASFIYDTKLQNRIDRFKQKKILSGNKFKREDILPFIKKNYGLEGVQRYKIANFIMEKHKLIIAQDMLLALSCNNKSKIIYIFFINSIASY